MVGSIFGLAHRPQMALSNGTRPASRLGIPTNSQRTAPSGRVWRRESLLSFVFAKSLSKTANLKLAERVGVLDRDFAKPNDYSGFRLISRNRNDLASSNLRRRFRPFAGFCRFFYFNGTRNGTRRGILTGELPRLPVKTSKS